MQRALIIIGATLIVIGVAWPWIGKLGFGRLPGDIRIERGSFRFYFPLATSIVVSLVLTLVLWLIGRR